MTHIAVTGFGVFAGVEDNPSKRIVEELQSTGFSVEGAASISYQILEVSVDHCSKLHDSLISTYGDNQIYVHIGVDSKAEFIKLEQCAYNNMTFRVPDVCGYQPQDGLICSDATLDCPLHSSLPLTDLCDHLNATISSTEVQRLVHLSQDPGRYLCNYTYYQALLHQQQLNQPLRAVFVHVPPFEVIPQQVQVKVIKALLEKIAYVGDGSSR